MFSRHCEQAHSSANRCHTETDENQKTTSYQFDSVGCLTQTATPDGTSATISYRSPTTYDVVRSRSGESDFHHGATVDGLGRLARSYWDDPDCGGQATTEITYDNLGRKYSVTNAHCNSSTETDGTTYFGYDALGRLISITNPDQSARKISYWGLAQTVTDEGNGTRNVQRILQNDDLGRLAYVCEVTPTALTVGRNTVPTDCGLQMSGVGFLTTYSYDLLGNLTRVTQPGLNPRFFCTTACPSFG